MSKSLAFATLVLSSTANALSINNDQALFEDFKVTYSRQYASEAEESAKFVIFSANLRDSEELNQISAAANSSAVFGVTKFSDLSPAEFKSRYLNYVPTEKKEVTIVDPISITSIPNQVDWAGNLTTPVKDQGQCGSCWAFSATEQIESMSIKAGLLTPNDALAVQQIVSCDKNKDEGCNGGDTLTAYNYVRKAGGLESQTMYPYKSGKSGRTGKCTKPEKSNLLVDVVTSSIIAKGNEEQMSMVVATGPLSICVDAAKWQNYKHGVLTKAICKQALDHCVQLTGYDFTMTQEKEKIWWVRNSWNTDWGVKGFIALEYGENTCGIDIEPTTVTVKKV